MEFNMNTILLFFALPIATIILAIVVEKIIRCPVLTAATFFAIFLIVAFAVFDASFLIFVIAYTIIAFITAVIADFIFSRCRRRERRFCNCNCNEKEEQENSEAQLTNEEIERIATRVANILRNANNNCCNDIATINIREQNGERTTWCCRRR